MSFLLRANFGDNRLLDACFWAKNWNAKWRFKKFWLKANRTIGIKVSSLKASGHAVLAPKTKLWRFRHFYFLCLFFYLFVYSFICWDFRGALRWKSLCFFFRQITNSATEVRNSITLKRLKVETWSLELRWGTYHSFFVLILGQSVTRYGFPSQKLKRQM